MTGSTRRGCRPSRNPRATPPARATSSLEAMTATGSGHDARQGPKLVLSDDEWRRRLDPQEFEVPFFTGVRNFDFGVDLFEIGK